MPLLNTITSPYAEAFLQVADARKEVDQVVDQAKAVLDLWQASPELRSAMASPVLEVEAKKLLADRQRIGILDAVLERTLELHREQRNIALATVTSATALTEEQQAELTKKVQAVAGTDKLEINLKVDSDLIGGFVVKVGSKVIDASLAGQVRRLGLALAKVS